jgi:hypothetical protein
VELAPPRFFQFNTVQGRGKGGEGGEGRGREEGRKGGERGGEGKGREEGRKGGEGVICSTQYHFFTIPFSYQCHLFNSFI